MTKLSRVLLFVACALAFPSMVPAASLVFNGDPVNPVTGIPYEMLPGAALVLPGSDGVLGTADDVIDNSIAGDIDVVVRSGSLVPAVVLPPPTILNGRGSVPVAVAGAAAAGGTAIPFTTLLSDGVVDAAAPYGHLLAAADMDGIPVIVSAFGDLDGDGWIGPTNSDAQGASDNQLEVRELEPVGRAVALFSAGVARGSVFVRAGLPASQGGLSVVLTAMALTGPYDPAFLAGAVPSGPAISTALPFLPQRDLTRLMRDRATLVGPNTTLQSFVQFAALPTRGDFALPTGGQSPTVDVAVVNSQAAVAVEFIEAERKLPPSPRLNELALGTTGHASRARLRVLPVDRFGNLADPAGDFAVVLNSVEPLRILRPRAARAGTALPIDARGLDMLVAVKPRTTAGSGALMAVRSDAIIAALPYRVDEMLSRPRAEIKVPSLRAPTIQAAIAAGTDRNHDGLLVVEVASGIYRENVHLTRPLLLRGQGAEQTFVQGDGASPAVSIESIGVTVIGLTAVDGNTGFVVGATGARLSDARAWNNSGIGIAINSAGVTLERAEALRNGSHGVSVGAVSGATIGSANQLIDNAGAGLQLSGTQQATISGNDSADNGGGGAVLLAVADSVVQNNSFVNNVLRGLDIQNSSRNRIVSNMFSRNDDNGLSMDRTTDNLVSANLCQENNGYGMFLRRDSDDFAAPADVQVAPGDNIATGNRKGDVFIRTN